MADRGANACLKLFLIVVNFIFLLVGLGILGIGIFLSTNATLGKYQDILDGLEMLRSVRFILIGLGCVITLVGFCGFIGACKENRCLIAVYLVFLILILIANIAAIALSVVFEKQAKSYLTEQIKDRLKRYYGNSSEPGFQTFTKGIDTIQKDEQCCGWTGVRSENFYISTPWYQQQQPDKKSRFPDSCCVESIMGDPEKKSKCVNAATPDEEEKAREDGFIHNEDCSVKLTNLSNRYTQAVLGAIILAILLQVICLTCSIVIARQISGNDAGRVV